MSNFERTVIVGGRNFEKLRLRVAYAQANGMELALPYTVMDWRSRLRPEASMQPWICDISDRVPVRRIVALMRHADSAIILPVERRDSISEMRTHGEKFEYLRREQVVNTVARMVVELDLPCIPAHTIQLSEPRSDNWFE